MKRKDKILYIICVANGDKRTPTRLISPTLDHLKATLRKFRDEDIFYFCRREVGEYKFFDMVKEFLHSLLPTFFNPPEKVLVVPVFSQTMGQLVKTKENAFKEFQVKCMRANARQNNKNTNR